MIQIEKSASYLVVKAQSLKELVAAIDLLYYEDWKPQGGIAIDEEGYYQAMIPKGD